MIKFKKLCFLMFFIILLLIPINFLTVKSNIVFADGLNENIVSNNDLITYLSSSGSTGKSAGTTEELNTAKFLKTKLDDAGLSPYDTKNEEFLQQFSIGIGNVSYNVIGVQKSKKDTQKTIAIGAHYDNTYSTTGSAGVFNNATGVVTLLALVKKLSTMDFDFNIHYCFFGASDANQAGSSAYLNSIENKSNLLLYINLDSIGGGDYTYYYAGDCANSFTEAFNLQQNNINALPIYKKCDYILSKQSYTHKGLQSDNITFLKKDINSITFFGGNYTSLSSGFKESDTYPNISNTKKDNYLSFAEYYPNYVDKLNNVANSIYTALTNDELIGMLEKSNNEIHLTIFTNKGIILAIGILGILLLCGIRNKEKKEIIKNE